MLKMKKNFFENRSTNGRKNTTRLTMSYKQCAINSKICVVIPKRFLHSI
uniref:Uncharacterized protein n=1 Tax=Ascaris lumbricoides TaxID=6252 RepID=A0A0M3IXP2_ASCLU